MNIHILEDVKELMELYVLRDCYKEDSTPWNEYNEKIQAKRAIIQETIIKEEIYGGNDYV